MTKRDKISVTIAITCIAIWIISSWGYELFYDELHEIMWRPDYNVAAFMFWQGLNILIFGLGVALTRTFHDYKVIVLPFRYLVSLAFINIVFDFIKDPKYAEPSKIYNVLIDHGFFLVHTVIMIKFRNKNWVKKIRL